MTQKLSKRGAFLAASLVLGAAFAATSLSAQTVSTAPVGAVTKTINVGLNAVGITLLNPDRVVASASANTASIITLTGVTNVGSLLTAGLPYYVEAISGALEGERFDVDTAATITAANGTVRINTSSANNTFTLAADNAIGSQFALRQHVTVSQIQSFFTTALTSSTNVNNADQIRVFNPSSGSFVIYQYRAANTWVQGATNVNNAAIPPGVGIFFRKVGSAATLVMTGGVRVNDFSMPMAAGLSFRAPGYPVSYSPTKLGAFTANGWTFNNSANSADQIRIYNGGTGAFVTYFYRTSTSWVQGATNVTTTDVIPFDSAYVLSRRTADTNYILNSPITL
jgi:hypothetical protein